jgi:hypothetical protein
MGECGCSQGLFQLRPFCLKTARLYTGHMMMPALYVKSCATLLGAGKIIDHNPMYVNQSQLEAAKLVPKLNLAFAYESRWQENDEYEGWRVSSNNFLQASFDQLAEFMNDPGCG